MFNLGDLVTYKEGDVLERGFDWNHNELFTSRKLWKRKRETKTAPDLQEYNNLNVVGTIVGIRKLSNGMVYHGETNEYRAREYMTAYLIAFDVRAKHVLVLPDDVKEL